MLPMSLKKLLQHWDAGTKANTLHISDSNLSEGILEGAKKAKADVIVMASHKRTGIKRCFIRQRNTRGDCAFAVTSIGAWIALKLSKKL